MPPQQFAVSHAALLGPSQRFLGSLAKKKWPGFRRKERLEDQLRKYFKGDVLPEVCNLALAQGP